GLAPEYPATRMRPELSTAIAVTHSPLLAPRLVMTLPPVPKVVSSVPFALYRATAHSEMPFFDAVVPATTILLVPIAWGWRATASAPPDLPKSVAVWPPLPKEVSREPSAL